MFIKHYKHIVSAMQEYIKFKDINVFLFFLVYSKDNILYKLLCVLLVLFTLYLANLSILVQAECLCFLSELGNIPLHKSSPLMDICIAANLLLL